MSNRFHNKWHRVSHHTYKDPAILDAGWDPIASHECPFQGDFVINGEVTSGGQSPGGIFSRDMYTVDIYPGSGNGREETWARDTIGVHANLNVSGNTNVGGDITATNAYITGQLSATSATIIDIEISATEGRGFIVTGYASGEDVPSGYFEIPTGEITGGIKNVYLDKVGLYVDGWTVLNGETEANNSLILQTSGHDNVGSDWRNGAATTVLKTDAIINYPSGGGENVLNFPYESGTVARLEDMGPEFDSTKLYVPGELVTYNRKLYRCVLQHAGEWNALHFIETTIDDSLLWRPGSGVNSVLQRQNEITGIIESGETLNSSVSQSSTVDGGSNMAGLKGYRYVNEVGTAITNQLVFDAVPAGWAAEDVVSVINESKYPDAGTIQSIDADPNTGKFVVTFKANLNVGGTVKEDDGWDAQCAYVSAKPDKGNIDLGYGAHAEGVGTNALNVATHAEGRETKALGQYSHAEGRDTTAQYCAHAEGRKTKATGSCSHAEGGEFTDENDVKTGTVASGTRSHAEGEGSLASGVASHAEGRMTVASEEISHAEGNKTTASGKNSHAEGFETMAIGSSSHAEGVWTRAGGDSAKGAYTKNLEPGKFTHAEGNGTFAKGMSSHSEGYGTQALNENSHAEGKFTTAEANNSHAEGNQTKTNGAASHAEGSWTRTNNVGEHAEGQYNLSHSRTTGTDAEKLAGSTTHSIGIGASDNRKNAVEVMQDGKVYVKDIGSYTGQNNPADASVSDLATVVNGKIGPIISKTWAELKFMRDDNSGAGSLVPGQWYRITDYVATTVQADTQSANHPFDIIVRADSTNKLNENAYAIKNAEDTTYFVNSKLEAWQVWYCLDNDTNRFAWADSNGKGVVYRLIDEFNNDCPYDFKGITMKAYGDTDNVFRYTFDSGAETGNTDYSLNNGSLYINTNKIAPFREVGRLKLNRIVFKGHTCYSNVFGYDCTLNTFGSMCSCNVFGAGSHQNVFGDECCGNVFGDGCHDNKFGGGCGNNKFEANCSNNTFDDACADNVFRQGCEHNRLMYNCSINMFGVECRYNVLDETCISNVFSDACSHNTLDDSCYHNTFGNSCEYNTFGSECGDNAFGAFCSKNVLGGTSISNTFGNYCTENILGGSGTNNTFGGSCDYNIIGESSNYNTFGRRCTLNVLGYSCQGNVFGEVCYGNVFGDERVAKFAIALGQYAHGDLVINDGKCWRCTSGKYTGSFSATRAYEVSDSVYRSSKIYQCTTTHQGPWNENNFTEVQFGDVFTEVSITTTFAPCYQNVTIEDGNCKILLFGTESTDSGDWYQNVTVEKGVNSMSDSYKLIQDSRVNQNFKTTYKPVNSLVLSV